MACLAGYHQHLLNTCRHVTYMYQTCIIQLVYDSVHVPDFCWMFTNIL